MLYNVFPCILKQGCSTKYFQCIILATRNKRTTIKHTSAKAIFAASSSAPIQKHSLEETKVEVPDIIGGNNGSVEKHLKQVIQPEITSSIASAKNKKVVDEEKQIKLLNTVKPSFLEWHKQEICWSSLPKHYKGLSKLRLSGLVVLTTLSGYGLAPGPIEPVTMLCMVIGTGLTSAAANAINQVLEVPYDSQMSRTKNRVLIRGFLTPFHALTFATCSATIGLATLYLGTNMLTASLGLTNLLLYTSVYTPMKRYSIANTWFGSIVGAIPPLMGWAASTGTLDSGALLLGAILYSWQFPHFNSLSWNLRADYSRAGYRMTSVINPSLCRAAALRHSIALLVFCSVAPLLDLTTWTFAFDSLPLNCYFIYCAWKFYEGGDAKSARKLFRTSLIYLPVLMFLMFVGKKHHTKEDKSINANQEKLKRQ